MSSTIVFGVCACSQAGYALLACGVTLQQKLQRSMVCEEG